jgi:hypothetical protein
METTENTKTATEMTTRQEALARRFEFDTFAELTAELEATPRPMDYYAEMTEDEIEAYCWEG